MPKTSPLDASLADAIMKTVHHARDHNLEPARVLAHLPEHRRNPREPYSLKAAGVPVHHAEKTWPPRAVCTTDTLLRAVYPDGTITEEPRHDTLWRHAAEAVLENLSEPEFETLRERFPGHGSAVHARTGGDTLPNENHEIHVDVGDHVTYVDEQRRARAALVTLSADTDRPTINLVSVSMNEDETDGHGRQLDRASSVSHQDRTTADGRYWRLPEEDA